MARMTFSPTPAYGEGAMPPRIVFTAVIPTDSRRTAAAVNTGKLETPERMQMPAAFACASNAPMLATKSDPSARSR
jgi:hypothetical protein